MKRRAFTLMELLIVMVIITILMALLVPAISRTKESARSAACLNNLHQIGIALQVYVQDNDNYLPVMYDRGTNSDGASRPSIDQVLYYYVRGQTNVFHCLSDNRRLFESTGSSYAWNNLLNGQNADRLQIITNNYPLTQIFVVFDKEKFHIIRGDLRAINFLYADGHIKNLMELQEPR